MIDFLEHSIVLILTCLFLTTVVLALIDLSKAFARRFYTSLKQREKIKVRNVFIGLLTVIAFVSFIIMGLMMLSFMIQMSQDDHTRIINYIEKNY